MKRLYLVFILLVASLINGPAYAQQVLPPAYKQRENNVCVFNLASLDFNSNPVAIGRPYLTNQLGFRSAASICDANGQLLFYTDGNMIYQANNQVMKDGANVTGTAWIVLGAYVEFSCTYTGVAIAPIPDSPGKYYVFAEVTGAGYGYIYDTTLKDSVRIGLFYTEVDMNLNNGLGAVVPGKKGVLMHTGHYGGNSLHELLPGLTTVAGNDCNVWLITMVSDTPVYRVYEITNTGINPTPVISSVQNRPLSIGIVSQGYTACALAAVSPNRKKLAANFIGGGVGSIEVTNFDASTGKISNPAQLPSSQFSGNVVFSPDNSKLYAFNNDYHNGSLLQYDIGAGPGPWLYKMVDSETQYISLKLAPDDKIYGNVYDTFDYNTYIQSYSAHVVENPNQPGSACNVSLQPPANLVHIFSSYFGFPYFFYNESPVIYNHDTATQYKDQSICFKTPTITLQAKDTTGGNYLWSDYNRYRFKTFKRDVDSPGVYILTYNTHGCHFHADTFFVRKADYTIDIGPDTAICNNTSYTLQAQSVPDASYNWQDNSTDSTYTVTQSATYTVTVSKYGCIARDTAAVDFVNIKQQLNDDTAICKGTRIELPQQANVPTGADVLWSDGSTEATFVVRDTGTYWLTVSKAQCVGTDTMHVNRIYCDCAVSMPSGFTPNGDGKNDVFRPVLPGSCTVGDYVMNIYNRWGTLVFTTTNITAGWDGNINGVPAELGTYMYIVRMEAGLSRSLYDKQGDVTLLR